MGQNKELKYERILQADRLDSLAKADAMTKVLWEGAVRAHGQLEQLRLILINIKIATAKLQGNPEGQALQATADIIERAIIELEGSTKVVRDVSKVIAKLIKEGRNE